MVSFPLALISFAPEITSKGIVNFNESDVTENSVVLIFWLGTSTFGSTWDFLHPAKNNIDISKIPIVFIWFSSFQKTQDCCTGEVGRTCRAEIACLFGIVAWRAWCVCPSVRADTRARSSLRIRAHVCALVPRRGCVGAAATASQGRLGIWREKEPMRGKQARQARPEA